MSENRAKQHKFAGKKDGSRENRRNVAVQLRKTAREDQMTKRRNVEDMNKSPLKEKSPMRDLGPNYTPKMPKDTLTLDDAEKLILSSNRDEELHAVHSLRKMLSSDHHPPIDKVINRGLVPTLIQKLTNFSFPGLQFEAAWALTNIASGTSEQTRAVVEAGAIPALVNLFDVDDIQTVEQSIWALGNIAGDGQRFRDMVLANNVISKLMKHINSNNGDEFLRNLTWMISNLCRNKPTPPIELIKPLLAPLNCLIEWSDQRVQSDACWALSYITDSNEEHVQAVCDTECMVERMIKLVASEERLVIVPSLRAIGNIVTATDAQTQFVIDCGFTKVLPNLLQSRHATIVKEACWAISNITAGTKRQIQEIQNLHFIPDIVRVLHSAEFKTQKEAAYVVANMASSGTTKNVEYLVTENSINAMGGMLGCADAGIIILCLEFFSNVLKTGEINGQIEEYSTIIEESGVLERIENLQNHENEEVYNNALVIIETYFSEEEAQTKTTDGFYEFRNPLAEANTNFEF